MFDAPWIIHPIAGVLLAKYMGVVWHKGEAGNRRAAILAAVLAVLAILGAGWVVHPAAAVSLVACFAFAGGNLFKRHNRQSVRALVSTAAFGVLGAEWVFIPLVVATAISLIGGRDRSLNDPPRVFARKPVNVWPPVEAQQPESPGRARTLTVLAQHPRLPSDSAKRAKALNLQCFEALAYIDERGPGGDHMRFEVEQIQGNFAVEAIGAYLALAPSRANTAVLRDGKTGQDLLNEQLDLLSDGVHRVMQRAEDLGAEQILASHTFVQQKFADSRTRELEL